LDRARDFLPRAFFLRKISVKGKQGFASMSPERRRKIQSKGGKAVPGYKRVFSRDRELARRAGKIGGENAPTDNRSFNDKDFASRMGKLGGWGSKSRKTQLRARDLASLKKVE